MAFSIAAVLLFLNYRDSDVLHCFFAKGHVPFHLFLFFKIDVGAADDADDNVGGGVGALGSTAVYSRSCPFSSVHLSQKALNASASALTQKSMTRPLVQA